MSIKNCASPSICNIPVKESATYLGIQICKDKEMRCRSNYNPIIDKTQKKFNFWLLRNLSLRGRVLLSKAEGISRLSYVAQFLFVDKSTCKMIDVMLLRFLWKNKSHYIRKSVVLNSYKKGGLDFIDFNSLSNTLKMNWLKRFLHNQSSIWNVIPRYIFAQLGGIDFLLLCNYSISKLPIKLSNYHQQMLLAWGLIYKHNFSPHSFFIWNNCYILHRKKTLFLEQWFKKGLLLVSQLFHINGTLFSHSDFVLKYQFPVSRREYNLVFKAISLKIGLLFRNNNSSIIFAYPPKLDSTVVGSICFSKLKSQNYKIRSLFVDLISSVPSSISFWNNLFEDINWPLVWSLPKKIFLTNKVTEISFKIIHRFYPVKLFIKKFRNNIDPLCSFCESANETVNHLFWDCSFSQSFWYGVKTLIIQKIFREFSLCYRHILFGFFTSDKILTQACFCINLLLFIGKFIFTNVHL